MSNLKNAFGNSGWIQSSIDHSRGKTRPGAKARKGAKRDKRRRKNLLENDVLYRKEMGLPPLVNKKKLSLKDLIKSAAKPKTGILNPNARPVG